MRSPRESIPTPSDGDSVAYALTLAMSTTLFVAITAGEAVAPFVPHDWQTAVNLAAAAPVIALALWRRWQLLGACLDLVERARRHRR